VSKVTPRILGVLWRGIGELSMEMEGESLDWRLSEVKRVTEDLWGAMERPLEDAQEETEERWELRESSDSGMEGEEWWEVKSSA